MGINNFHKWVDATFDSTQKASRVDCEDLLIDMNSLVHGAARKASTPTQAVKLILKRLEGLLDERRPGCTVRASQTLGLFSDGVAPLAKVTTQRKRRLQGRCASRADGCDEDVIDATKFSSLMISPGTQFSVELAQLLDAWAVKRLAKGRGFKRVVHSDAMTAGEGELKAFEYCDTYPTHDVVIYGGDADLVAMALSRCSRPGRLRILDEGGRLIDVKRLASKLAPAHPLDLAVLAIAGGGNDYLPGLLSAPALWAARKKAKAGPLYSGSLDRAAFASVLRASSEGPSNGGRGGGRGRGRGRGGGGGGEGDKALVAEASLGRRRTDGAPAAPRAVMTSLEPRRADLVTVRVLPPRDFGDVARGAETLTYRVRWRRDRGPWLAAQTYEDGAPLDAVLLATLSLKKGLAIRVPAGCGDVEVCASAQNSKGWGAVRTARQRRAARFCLARGSNDDDAQTNAELQRQPAAAEVESTDDAPAPAVPGALAKGWDATTWLDQLDWTLQMYVRGRCVDYRLRYAFPGKPPVADVIKACGAPAQPCLMRPPISPVAALACLIPGRSAAALLPPPARGLLEDGVPTAPLWWGANDAIDVDAIETAVDAAVPPVFGTPVVIDARGRSLVKLLEDGAAAYPAAPKARFSHQAPPRGGHAAPPPRGGHAAPPPRGPRGGNAFPPPPAHSLARRPPPPPQASKVPRGDTSAYQSTSSGGGERVPRNRTATGPSRGGGVGKGRGRGRSRGRGRGGRAPAAAPPAKKPKAAPAKATPKPPPAKKEAGPPKPE